MAILGQSDNIPTTRIEKLKAQQSPWMLLVCQVNFEK
jgi:hypothetical protein